MGRLFRYDTPIMEKLRRASEVFFCGIYFFVTCLPILTIGASLSTMYRMMFNFREEKDTSAAVYFKTFRKEFKKSTLLGLLCLLSALIVCGLMYLILLLNPEGALRTLLIAFFIIVLLLWAFTFLYVFPLESHFENKVLTTIKNAALISVTHRRQTIPALFLSMLPVFGYIISPYWFLCTVPVWIFAIIPAVFYFQSGLFCKVFEKFIPNETEEQETQDDGGTEA